MSLSIQTNVASLIAQNNIRINNNFQNNTIQQLSSGFRINTSADDAAGLAVANRYRGNTAELTQGVLNANNGVSALQIVDGGLTNISAILDRLRTLATESASATFTGDRGTLNQEYQGLLSEVNRQAANVNLNTGGAYNTHLITYVAGGSNVNVKKPFSWVVKVRVMARSALKIVTLAPLTDWPEESKTVPLIEAVIWDCPMTVCPLAKNTTSADSNTLSLRNLIELAMPHTPSGRPG